MLINAASFRTLRFCFTVNTLSYCKKILGENSEASWEILTKRLETIIPLVRPVGGGCRKVPAQSYIFLRRDPRLRLTFLCRSVSESIIEFFGKD
jgi:hypothetical protein